MRKHDQPGLHPHYGVGLGLILAASIAFASQAQDREGAAAQGPGDPIDLAARRIMVWDGPGERWAVLSGDAAVLQGAEGVRCRGAVVRIVEVAAEGGKLVQAEVYAEGNVRITGQAGHSTIGVSPRSGRPGECRSVPTRHPDSRN